MSLTNGTSLKTSLAFLWVSPNKPNIPKCWWFHRRCGIGVHIAHPWTDMVAIHVRHLCFQSPFLTMDAKTHLIISWFSIYLSVSVCSSARWKRGNNRTCFTRVVVRIKWVDRCEALRLAVHTFIIIGSELPSYVSQTSYLC